MESTDVIVQKNGTFILGFSKAKLHFAVAPEKHTLDTFAKEIEKTGYQMTKMFMKIKWTDEVNYTLLYDIIDFNIHDKKDSRFFWRQ